MNRHAAVAISLCVGLLGNRANAEPDAAAQATPRLSWRLPAAAEVTWRGQIANGGGAVGAGPQIGLCPVPGPAGLLVAIFAHGAIMQGLQSSQQAQQQQEADAVLRTYAPVLKAWPAF